MLKKLKEKLFSKNIPKQIENIQIEPTTFCNLSCMFCWHAIDNVNTKAKEMSFDLFKEIIDTVTALYQVKTLCLQGLGEPLMCKDLLKMIKYAKKEKNLNVWFTTNGTLFNQDNIAEITDIKTDKIRISLDAVDIETNEKLRRKHQGEKIAAALRLINQEKKNKSSKHPAIALNTVVSTTNIDHLHELIAFAQEHEIEEITLIPLVAFKEEDHKYLVDFSDNKFLTLYKELQRKAETNNIDINLGIAPGNKNLRFCTSGVFADVSGNIHPCCNLETVRFSKNDKLLKKHLQKFRHKTKKLTCAKCFEKHGH